METKVEKDQRKETYQSLAADGKLLGGGLPYPVGTYHFQLLDDDAFSTREIRNSDRVLLLVRGQISAAEQIKSDNGGKAYSSGQILDKGHRSVAVDSGELWAEMRKGVVYSFTVDTYDKVIKDEETGVEKTVPRKITTGWREVSEIEQS